MFLARPAMPATGVGLALASAAAFGTSGTFATPLLHSGWSPGAAVLARISIAALVLTAPAVRQLRRTDWRLLRQHTVAVVIYGLIAVAGCQVAYFNAVERISVGVALLLEYLGVVLVVGWLWLRHGQRPRRLTVAGSITAIAGLLLVLDLTGGQTVNFGGLCWGLAAAAGLAFYYVNSARSHENLPPLVMAWAAMVVAALTLTVVGLLGVMPLHARFTAVTLAKHRMSWLVPVLGLAVIAAAFAYVAGIDAARLLGPKLSSFLGFAEVLFAILFAWLALGQLPTSIQFAGGALIVLGVVAVRIDDFRSEPAAVPMKAQAATDAETGQGVPVAGGTAR